MNAGLVAKEAAQAEAENLLRTRRAEIQSKIEFQQQEHLGRAEKAEKEMFAVEQRLKARRAELLAEEQM